jgi:hypothetical protein
MKVYVQIWFDYWPLYGYERKREVAMTAGACGCGCVAAVYANPAAFDECLVREILGATENEHGHATFTSIMFAPKAEVRVGPLGRVCCCRFRPFYVCQPVPIIKA